MSKQAQHAHAARSTRRQTLSCRDASVKVFITDIPSQRFCLPRSGLPHPSLPGYPLVTRDVCVTWYLLSTPPQPPRRPLRLPACGHLSCSRSGT